MAGKVLGKISKVAGAISLAGLGTAGVAASVSGIAKIADNRSETGTWHSQEWHDKKEQEKQAYLEKKALAEVDADARAKIYTESGLEAAEKELTEVKRTLQATEDELKKVKTELEETKATAKRPIVGLNVNTSF